VGTSALTEAGLAKFEAEIMKFKTGAQKPDEDILTEFSIASEESQMDHLENAMDLVVSTANFDKGAISKMMGNKEVLEEAFQTFATVDFFNHDTKHSEVAQGFSANYSFNVSFRNKVENFYIDYLSTNYATLEFYMVRAQSALKIGSAKIPLQKLLEGDTSMQAMVIVSQGTEMVGPETVGRVFYKMRMRKPLEEAALWRARQEQIKQRRDPTLGLTQDHHALNEQ